MKRWRIEIAYDGRPFEGWQSQPGGNTVQDHLEVALRSVCKDDSLRIHGSGRTDSGVHALGQVAHFEVPEANGLDERSWVRALNANLPPSIRVNACALADENFHARFSALGKTYRYRIWRGEVLPPLEVGLAWHVHWKLDGERLQEAAAAFVGRHDFAGFAANRGDGKDEGADTVREVFEVDVQEADESIQLTFRGSGFLYKMVRLMTGSIIHAADGKTSAEEIRRLLENADGAKAGYCAPADGLYLVHVAYD